MEDFTNAYTTHGQKLIAASTYSMLNDLYYGVMHKPFRQLQDFEVAAPHIKAKVNKKYINFALCLHHASDFWGNEAAIQEAMELEAHNKAFIDTILSKVKAHTHIVQKYLAGEIPQEEEEVESSQDSAASAIQAEGRIEKKKLTHSQKRLAKAIRPEANGKQHGGVRC